MIKNIIFDLGLVLLDFNPDNYLKKCNLSDEDIPKYKKMIWGSAEWYQCDRGDFDYEEMIDKILNQYKSLTGISVERIDNRTMKIDFNLTEKNKGYYIILYFENECFSVIKIFPEEIKFQKYLNNNNINSIQNLTLFLGKLINYEFIPLLNE